MRDDRWIRRIAPLLAALAVACGAPTKDTRSAAPRTPPTREPGPVGRAASDDVEGLARELSEPAYRAEAVDQLRRHFDRALGVADGDPAANGPAAITAQSSEALVEAYVDEDDPELRLVILQLLVDMRARGAWPAYERALDWRAEATEAHAIAAAAGMEAVLVDDAPAEAHATTAGAALRRIEGSRGVDNRMRIHLVRALGAIDHPASRDALAAIAERIDDEQNFLIHRLALEELGAQAHPSSVPTLIRALFLWGPGRPDMRMNDIAAQGLVQVGRPALQPALDLLAGQNTEANALARSYIDAVRERDAQIAAQMSAEVVVASEAAFVLGQLGFVEALDPLLAETRHADADRRLAAAVSMMSLSGLSDAQRGRVREALQRVYGRSEPMQQMQILVAMQRSYDAGYVPFLLRVARDRAAPQPDARVIAVRALALLATAHESRAIRRIIAREPPAARGGFAENLQENLPRLDAATRCDEDTACWRSLLGDDDPPIVRKALYVLARLDTPWADVRGSVIPLIAHEDVQVRGDALYAIDQLSVDGHRAVVEAVDALRRDEEGRASWTQVKDLALAIRARQLTRIGAQP